MAALYDGDGNRLFTMDYTGGCDKPERHDPCDFEECPFHDEDYRHDCMEDMEIWIPDCGSDTDKTEAAGTEVAGSESINTSAEDAMKELASLVSRKAQKHYSITEYVNDITFANEEVLVELDIKGNIASAYTYGYNRVSNDVGDDTLYYLYDAHGSVTRIASEWGRVQETYSYDPYGNLTYGLPDTGNFFGYNGESTNLFTGLQYLRARYYDMENGSFLSEDTYAGSTTQPLSLNRYTYVSNNPVNYSDPSGHIRTYNYALTDTSGGSGIAKKQNNVFAKPSTPLPQPTAYQPLQTRLEEAAKLEEEIKQVAKDAEAAGIKPNNQSQKAGNTPCDGESEESILDWIMDSPVVEYLERVNEVYAQQQAVNQEVLVQQYQMAQTEEGRQYIASVFAFWTAFVTAIVLAPIAIPAVVGYLGLTEISAMGLFVLGAGIEGSIFGATYELSEDIYSGKISPQTFTDTLQAIVDGLTLGMASGVFEYPIFKAIQKIVKIFEKIDIPKKGSGVVDDVVEGGTSQKITSNLGKEIDITPSSNHSTVTSNPGYKGTPNSSVDILDSNGDVVTRRWYDSNGNAYRDVDMTNHGNPTTHPEWPHEHIWEYDENGIPRRR